MEDLESWQRALFDLHLAESVDDLQRVLTLDHGISGSADAYEPLELLRRFHGDGSAGALFTATLLCTDYRWRRASRRLIAGIAESGILDADALDELAEIFIRDAVTVSVPVEWFGGEVIELIDRGVDSADRATLRVSEVGVSGDVEVARDVDNEIGTDTLYASRRIWPPLRRWATARIVTRDPGRWRELIDQARTVGARDGAFLVAGVLDAAAALNADQKEALIAVTVRWPDGTVRLAVLPVVAAVHGIDEAQAWARRDSSAKVRAWATRVAKMAPVLPGLAVVEAPPSTSSRTARAADQPSLFSLGDS